VGGEGRRKEKMGKMGEMTAGDEAPGSLLFASAV
jgi:hypothetical protein